MWQVPGEPGPIGMAGEPGDKGGLGRIGRPGIPFNVTFDETGDCGRAQERRGWRGRWAGRASAATASRQGRHLDTNSLCHVDHVDDSVQSNIPHRVF